MILQALVGYYDRQRALPETTMPPYGWVRRPIDYIFELDSEGNCTNVLTIASFEKGKRIGMPSLVPAIGKQALKHTNSGKDANLLWDGTAFALGWQDDKGSRLPSFVAAIDEWFSDVEDSGLRAVRAFVRNLQARPGLAEETIRRFRLNEDFAKHEPVIAFQLAGDEVGPVHFREAVRRAFEARLVRPDDQSPRGNCLLSGATDAELADNETVIKGVKNSQTSGANLVSFNSASFVSYGKGGRGGECAPISKRASFAYTTALNHLLDYDSRNRVQVGDASTVFWADRESRFDGEFTLADLFGENKDNPDRGAKAVGALFDALKTGRLPVGERDVRFFVLGLAPNAARISVRFWLHAPFAELAPRILQHFADLSVVRQRESDPIAPSIFALLRAIAPQGNVERFPDRLAGEWIRSVLEGSPYPPALAHAAVARFKVAFRDEKKWDPSYLIAAVLKAWLNRDHRKTHPDLPPDHQHFKEELDLDQTDTPYRLGRLFAVLERIQSRAMPGINATIRDRYYSAASTTPVAVFTTLLRLKNAHQKKLVEREQGYFEKLIGEVLEPMADFPRQLTLPQQARFALGYYHQRQHFFTRKDNDNPAQEN